MLILFLIIAAFLLWFFLGPGAIPLALISYLVLKRRWLRSIILVIAYLYYLSADLPLPK